MLILASVIMSLYTYYYETTNHVGVLGDGKFHFKTIITFIFAFFTGVSTLVSSLIQITKEKKKR